MTNSWTVTYDDGGDVRTTGATGKLSLDPTWLFIMGMDGSARQSIVLAVPSWRVIDVKNDDA
jgi:hypothetical protein